MLQGLNIAAAGMAAQQQKLDAVSNDLANANTTGYKHDRVGFRDLVYTQAQRSSAQGVRTGAGVAAVEIGRGFSQGALQQTGQPLDVAIEGEGFLQVRLPDGRTGLTRDGNLRRDPQGRLATSTGALLQPSITIPANIPLNQVSIASDGTVSAAGRAVGRLSIVSVRNQQGLQSVGDNAFVATAASGRATNAPAATRVTQGTLEASNVDVSEAMVAMIEAQRSFQLASKAISTADQMMEIANGVKR
jgi:flagellar basal-body rod protein FlgG